MTRPGLGPIPRPEPMYTKFVQVTSKGEHRRVSINSPHAVAEKAKLAAAAQAKKPAQPAAAQKPARNVGASQN